MLQDLRSMAFGFDDGPDGFDFAGFPDEEGAADDAHEFSSHELLLLPRAKLFDGFVVGVAEQRKVEFFLFLERGLRFDGIGAHAQDRHAQFVEFSLCVTKLGRLDDSTGGVGLGKEEEQDAAALEVLQGKLFPFIGRKTEVRGCGANFEHRCTSAVLSPHKRKASTRKKL